MGIHARNRPRGRTIAKGALALGATLTGFGLTAAAFDSGGVAQAESSGAPGLSPYSYSDSGLGAPVAIADVMATPSIPVGSLGGGGLPSRSVTTSRPSNNAPPATGRHAATTPAKTAPSTTTIKTAPPVVVAAAPQPQTRSATPPTSTSTTTPTPTPTSTSPTKHKGGSAPTTTTPPSNTTPPAKSSPPTHTSPPASDDLPVVSDLSALGSLLGKLPIVGSLLGLL